MVNDQFRQLTDKLYQEGIEKAEKEAALLMARAQEKADSVLKEAQLHAQEIRQKAEAQQRQDLENHQKNLQIAVQKALAQLRQSVLNLMTKSVIEPPLRLSLQDPHFLQKIIQQFIDRWSPAPSEAIPLKVWLSPEDEQTLTDFFKNNALKILDQSLVFEADPHIPAGFKIGPQDGHYRITFTEEALQAFFTQYLHPALKPFLFGPAASESPQNDPHAAPLS
ncbi:MAG: hypothetical protein HC913_20970 [Microscillaceae bacterium]|nr:hypothetical protein [Microscillaceae bacterium]